MAVVSAICFLKILKKGTRAEEGFVSTEESVVGPGSWLNLIFTVAHDVSDIHAGDTHVEQLFIG